MAPPCIVIFKLCDRDFRSFRNGIMRSRNIMEKSFRGQYVGISNDASFFLDISSEVIIGLFVQVERVPPDEGFPMMNFHLGAIYFTDVKDAKGFLVQDPVFSEQFFVNSSNAFIVPLRIPVNFGYSN